MEIQNPDLFYSLIKNYLKKCTKWNHLTLEKFIHQCQYGFFQINLYWEVLNHGKDENPQNGSPPTITKDDFLQVANLLNVNIVQDTTYVNIFVRYAPQVYLSRPSRCIKYCVNHR